MVVEVDLLADTMQCPKCASTEVIPYDAIAISGESGINEIERWYVADYVGRDLVLTDGNYKCPQCREMTLHFKDGCKRWD